MSLQQRRNDAKIDANLFTNIVTKNKEVWTMFRNSSLYEMLTLLYLSPHVNI